jgi:hypothetical protein
MAARASTAPPAVVTASYMDSITDRPPPGGASSSRLTRGVPDGT